MAKKILIVVLVLVLTIIVSGSVLALYMLTEFNFTDFEMQNETGTATIEAQGNEDITKIVLNTDLETADLDIVLSSSGTNQLFKADWSHSYMTDEDDRAKIKFTNTTSNGVLTINVNIEYPEDFNWDFQTWDVNIEIDPDLESYSFVNEITTGDLDISLSEITIDQIDLETTTGDMDVYLTDCKINSNIVIEQTTGSLYLEILTSTVSGNIQIEQTTGDSTIKLEDIILSKDITFSKVQTTGDTNIIWDQSVALTHDFDMQSDCTTGDIEMTITTPTSATRYDIVASTTTGDIIIEGISKITDNHYQSNDIDDETKDLISIDATVTTGDVAIQVYNS